VLVTELRDNTFYAVLKLDSGGHEIRLDSRSTGAIALAVRTDAPIFASNELVEENAIEFEREVDETDEIVEGFRDFLEKVSPDDFRVAQEILEGEDDELDDDEDDEDDQDDDADDEGPPSN
jgi:hypothetical protein